jgi:hypothetical protein
MDVGLGTYRAAMTTHLDSIVVDAVDPQALSRFWSQALDAPVTFSGPEGVRLALSSDPPLSLDFVPVPDREPRPHRLHLDLDGGAAPRAMVDRLVGLGAREADFGQGDVPWTIMLDPEDYAFCVMPGERYDGHTGPIGALPLDADDKEAAARFWATASGWDLTGLSLRHLSGKGPELAICDPVEPKRGKNPVHLDVRVAPGDDYDEQLQRLLDAGAVRLEHDWGELPWTVLIDPGGNECCLLPAEDPSAD